MLRDETKTECSRRCFACKYIKKSRIKSSSINGTCSKVDEQIEKEYGVRHTVENHPSRAVVIVEEWYCYGQNDQIGDQQQQHTTVPVKPATDNVSRHPSHNNCTDSSIKTCFVHVKSGGQKVFFDPPHLKKWWSIDLPDSVLPRSMGATTGANKLRAVYRFGALIIDRTLRQMCLCKHSHVVY